MKKKKYDRYQFRYDRTDKSGKQHPHLTYRFNYDPDVRKRTLNSFAVTHKKERRKNQRPFRFIVNPNRKDKRKSYLYPKVYKKPQRAFSGKMKGYKLSWIDRIRVRFFIRRIENSRQVHDP